MTRNERSQLITERPNGRRRAIGSSQPMCAANSTIGEARSRVANIARRYDREGTYVITSAEGWRASRAVAFRFADADRSPGGPARAAVD